MIRPILSALSVVAGFGIAAIAEEPMQFTEVAQCPAHRPDDLTYGGLTPVPGFRRDHWEPLCLGGLDMRHNCGQGPYSPPAFQQSDCNVWYEPLDESFLKDEAERIACRYACHAGSAVIEAARQDFRAGNWRKWLEP